MTDGREECFSDTEAQTLLANEDSDERSDLNETFYSYIKKNSLLDGSLLSIHSRKVVLKVYARRWFILGLFSILSFMQVSHHDKIQIP